MNKSILAVEAIQERDIDLLLLEELTTDIEFCKWFITELNLPELSTVNGSWKSISDFGLGETDILFSYNSAGKKVFVLIENKLDAPFQANQFERYWERANAYVSQKNCDASFVVLVAPLAYCENQYDFESYLTYESLVTRLASSSSKRAIFKSNLLKIAIEKSRRGYQAINSETVQSFWLAYWTYKEEKHPDLQMKKPDIVPHNSDWPSLSDHRLEHITFYHKLGKGYVDATFKDASEEFETKIKKSLPAWANFQSHSKSFSIRVISEKVDRSKPFNEQINSVEKGLQDLKKLRNWLLERKLFFH